MPPATGGGDLGDLSARAAAPLGRGARHSRQARQTAQCRNLISIGNGTASRETDKLATELVKLLPDLKMSKIVVSEAGASVYSASAYASEELPDLDVHPARRRVDRTPAAGSARRTGQDRSKIDRRWPVPA